MSHSPLETVKVLVVGNGSLLDEGIGNMLALHSQLSVTRISYTDDDALYDLVDFECPYTVFINEFDELDIKRVIKLIFSVPSAFVRKVIVVHVENSSLDVYHRPTVDGAVAMHQRESIVVNTKKELVNLALRGDCYA